VKEEEMMECKTRSKIRIQSTLSIKSQNIVKRTTVVPKHTLTTKLKLKFCASPTNNHQFYIIINGHGQSRVKWIWNTGGNRMAKHNMYLAANKNWCINTLATKNRGGGLSMARYGLRHTLILLQDPTNIPLPWLYLHTGGHDCMSKLQTDERDA
jgi:hypothetical protein